MNDAETEPEEEEVVVEEEGDYTHASCRVSSTWFLTAGIRASLCPRQRAEPLRHRVFTHRSIRSFSHAFPPPSQSGDARLQTRVSEFVVRS